MNIYNFPLFLKTCNFFISLFNYKNLCNKRLSSQNHKVNQHHKHREAHPGGFYTLEAAIVMPLFICLAVIIFMFFQILKIQWSTEAGAYDAVRTLTVYSGEVNEAGTTAAAAVKIAVNKPPYQFITGKQLGMSYLRSKVDEKDIDCIVDYYISIPGISEYYGHKGFFLSQRVKMRRWNGYDPAEAEDENGDYVYVTKHGEVYHNTLSCSYLDLSIQSASLGEISSMRNYKGGKYYSCEECGSKAKGIVYYTEYGTAYHSDLTCTGLKRTIRKIPRKEAENKYRKCPKCVTGVLAVEKGEDYGDD